MTAALRWHTYPGDGALVLRPIGDLTKDTYAQLRDWLLTCAAHEPPAIVVDLDGMRVAGPLSFSVFRAVRMRINDWPGVPMVLAAARQPLRTLLESSSVPGHVPTYRSVAEALDALGAAPPRHRRHMPLPCEVTHGRRVRRMVEQTCQEWGVPGIVSDAVLVASELTENVVRHARCEGVLRLELRGTVLSVAVTDTDSRPPRLRPAHQRRDGGRGLVLVAELSRAWGYAPRGRFGKVVWAVLTVPAG
ncbi:MAG TPA: ATP-binding protein [Pseudonocardiaceae bacterium]